MISIAATHRIYVNRIAAQGFTGNNLLELFCYAVFYSKKFHRRQRYIQFHGFPHLKLMTLEAQTFSPRLGASSKCCCSVCTTCMKALLTEFSNFLRRSVDFIIVSEGISETIDNKVKKDGNTWLGEVGYKKGNLLYSLSSMIGIGKKNHGWI